MRAVIIGLAIAVGSTSPALSQDLRGDLLRLQQEVNALKGQAETAARTTLQVQSLDEQVRAATGRFEEINFRLRRLEERMKALEEGADRRMAAIEDRLNAEPAAAEAGGPAQAAAPAGPDPESVLPDGNAESRYNYVFQLLQQRNYDEAETALAAYLQLYPNDERAPFAKFWLGETYRARGDFRNAALHFAEGFQTYAESGKAPDMLLKLGDSLHALGDNAKACGTYELLTTRFPEAPSNIQTMTERGQKRAGCS